MATTVVIGETSADPRSPIAADARAKIIDERPGSATDNLEVIQPRISAQSALLASDVAASSILAIEQRHNPHGLALGYAAFAGPKASSVPLLPDVPAKGREVIDRAGRERR